jgi:hypothetical protein
LGGEHLGHTIQATELVHETYLRLIDIERIDGRIGLTSSPLALELCAVFWSITRGPGIVPSVGAGSKRGGGFRRVDFKETSVVSSELGPQLLWMDEALNELAQFD